jgi:hypothetical protein
VLSWEVLRVFARERNVQTWKIFDSTAVRTGIFDSTKAKALVSDRETVAKRLLARQLLSSWVKCCDAAGYLRVCQCQTKWLEDCWNNSLKIFVWLSAKPVRLTCCSTAMLRRISRKPLLIRFSESLWLSPFQMLFREKVQLTDGELCLWLQTLKDLMRSTQMPSKRNAGNLQVQKEIFKLIRAGND